MARSRLEGRIKKAFAGLLLLTSQWWLYIKGIEKETPPGKPGYESGCNVFHSTKDDGPVVVPGPALCQSSNLFGAVPPPLPVLCLQKTSDLTFHQRADTPVRHGYS